MRHLLITLVSIGLVAATLPGSSAFADGTPAAQKDWTIMVYLNGNNSLDSYGTENLDQMEQVGSTDQFNVVVQWASMARKDTQRLLVKQVNETGTVTSPVVQDVGNVDMGDYNTLVDFAKWAITTYPAQHYLLDIWDHGSGWHQIELRGKRSAMRPSDISLDENTGHWITTQQLGTAIGQIATFLGHPLDVYASDACMMQMAEVAGEMAGSVQVFAGSEETEPGDGWSYGDFLKLLAAKPDASPSDMGTFLEKSYLSAYNGGVYGNQDVTYAAIDMSQFSAFEAGVKKFGSALAALSSSDAAKVVTAIGSSQAFTYADYVDVSDFLTTLAPAGVTSIGDDATTPLKTALASLIIGGGGTGNFARAKGLSMWIPSSNDTYNQYLSTYQQLKFDQATGWSTALKVVLGGTR